MAQVTKDFAEQMLVHCARGERPPLTVHECEQLARVFLRAQAAQVKEQEPVAGIPAEPGQKIGCVQHDCDECQQREKLKDVGVPMNLQADCSPTLTQCPRCNNPNGPRCDGGKAVGVPDLIARLKDASDVVGGLVGHVIDEAATELAALQADVAKLTRRKSFYRQEYIRVCNEREQQAERIAALQSQLDQKLKDVIGVTGLLAKEKQRSEQQAATIKELEAERDAAFAMSKCECGPDECCANLVKLHKERDAIAKAVARECAEIAEEYKAMPMRVGLRIKERFGLNAT